MNILALNAGSSSLKVALFGGDPGGEVCLASGSVRQLFGPEGRLSLKAEGGRALAEQQATFADHVQALEAMLDTLDAAKLPRPDAFGHRLVHGGPEHRAPVRVDPALRASLASLVRFAPLHLPAELDVLDAAARRSPASPHVVSFDTAFHRGLPEVAERLALPRALYDSGVRRYGFHGLSCEYVVETVGAATLGRAVIAHLGSGSSMTAIKGGHSIDTTMGLTPAGGLVMGTRVGDLDPGVMIHLLDEGHGARDLETLVNAQSGLLGLSGTTGDMQLLLATADTDARAAMAIEVFCYTARKFVGALTAVLGGLDTLVFTGGIGEGSPAVRQRICAGLGHLGVALDEARNAGGELRISRDRSASAVLVVPTDEEKMIARHTSRTLALGGAG